MFAIKIPLAFKQSCLQFTISRDWKSQDIYSGSVICMTMNNSSTIPKKSEQNAMLSVNFIAVKFAIYSTLDCKQ